MSQRVLDLVHDKIGCCLKLLLRSAGKPTGFVGPQLHLVQVPGFPCYIM